MPHADSLLFWQVVVGAEFCQIVDGGRCVSDGTWSYGVSEYCKVKALRPLVATATEFETEEGYDFFAVGGTQYHGSEGPQGVLVDAGAKLVWTSDGAEVRPGFTVCAAETSSLLLALCQLRLCFCAFIHIRRLTFASFSCQRICFGYFRCRSVRGHNNNDGCV